MLMPYLKKIYKQEVDFVLGDKTLKETPGFGIDTETWIKYPHYYQFEFQMGTQP